MGLGPLYNGLHIRSDQELLTSTHDFYATHESLRLKSMRGVKLPIRAMADVLAASNANRAPADRALLCVDGVHGLGVEDLDLTALGRDFFVSGCHTWLFGPRGSGFVWGTPPRARRSHPTQ